MNAVSNAPNAPHRALLTAADFLLLNENGAFDRYAKSELIEGEIICMNAQFSRHARIKTRLDFALETALRQIGSPLQVLIEAAVDLSDDSIPEPDITLCSYDGDKLIPLDTIALVVEVSDTTLSGDSGRKADLYARFGVPEYWVIDVAGARLLRMWQPSEQGFAQSDEAPLGDNLVSATIDKLSVRIER